MKKTVLVLLGLAWVVPTAAQAASYCFGQDNETTNMYYQCHDQGMMQGFSGWYSSGGITWHCYTTGPYADCPMESNLDPCSAEYLAGLEQPLASAQNTLCSGETCTSAWLQALITVNQVDSSWASCANVQAYLESSANNFGGYPEYLDYLASHPSSSLHIFDEMVDHAMPYVFTSPTPTAAAPCVFHYGSGSSSAETMIPAELWQTLVAGAVADANAERTKLIREFAGNVCGPIAEPISPPKTSVGGDSKLATTDGERQRQSQSTGGQVGDDDRATGGCSLAMASNMPPASFALILLLGLMRRRAKHPQRR
ncbi:MAG: hypothetical protein H6707_17155 [Deltaproteobacteria bacterium]|nr:hypothetical protein [Deltaproteobacteria bacterium]